MPFFEMLFGDISIQRMIIRCISFIHVCFVGTMVAIKIFALINMYFLWPKELTLKFDFHFQYLTIEAHILFCNNPDGETTNCKLYHSFISDLFLIVNFYLLKATFKKNITSIDKWLLFHGIHFLYMLSVQLIAITNCAYTLIYICIYCIYLLLVISFRMEESNNSIFHNIINYLYQQNIL